MPPRAGSKPIAVMSPLAVRLCQRAWAAFTHAVGMTCHAGSDAPAWKSPRSIWERSGSGSAWRTAL
ncbi:hypothetical protein D3C71_1824950 [compost metagenome]